MEAIARAHGARYIRTTSTAGGNAGQSHADALAASHAQVRGDYDTLAWFDHDLFPVADFTARGVLDGHDAAGVLQRGVPTLPGYLESWRYLWPGCCFLDNRPDNSDFSLANNAFCDVGGRSGEFIRRVGLDRVRTLHNQHLPNPYFDRGNYSVYALIDERFLHFINGSGWNTPEGATQDERLLTLFRLVRERAGITGSDT
jgi:hypothetical protein